MSKIKKHSLNKVFYDRLALLAFVSTPHSFVHLYWTSTLIAAFCFCGPHCVVSSVSFCPMSIETYAVSLAGLQPLVRGTQPPARTGSDNATRCEGISHSKNTRPENALMHLNRQPLVVRLREDCFFLLGHRVVRAVCALTSATLPLPLL